MSDGGESVLLIDDSEAILAFGREVLSRQHRVHTESRGDRALEAARRFRPALIVLDLSMPGLDGDEVLRRLKADPLLARIPVVMLSSEHERADECLDLGAVKFLAKPVTAEVLRRAVEEALAAARVHDRSDSVYVMRLELGPLSFAVPLEQVKLVCHQAQAVALPAGPYYLREAIELATGFVPVLDLAARLGLELDVPYLDRQLIVLEAGGQSVAVAVERVHQPEEVPPLEQLTALHSPAGLGAALGGLARTSRGALPVLLPLKLIDRGSWAGLSALLTRAEQGRAA